MSILPKYKIADCNQCGDKDVPCVKVGKEHYCKFKCHKNNKAKVQIDKAKERDKVRSLGKVQYVPEGTAELQRWFEDRHKEMKGKCQHCLGKTEKGKSTYKCSIAHILPKAYFKSVATHPLNWLELCFYNKSCHTNFDNMSLDIMELNCFDEIVTKFVAIYPSIAIQERRRIPNVLLQYVEVEK